MDGTHPAAILCLIRAPHGPRGSPCPTTWRADSEARGRAAAGGQPPWRPPTARYMGRAVPTIPVHSSGSGGHSPTRHCRPRRLLSLLFGTPRSTSLHGSAWSPSYGQSQLITCPPQAGHRYVAPRDMPLSSDDGAVVNMVLLGAQSRTHRHSSTRGFFAADDVSRLPLGIVNCFEPFMAPTLVAIARGLALFHRRFAPRIDGGVSLAASDAHLCRGGPRRTAQRRSWRSAAPGRRASDRCCWP